MSMPILSRHGIDPDIRGPYERQYKAQLRQALSNPGLTAEQRGRIKAELDQVGKPRVYDADSPPVPGAIDVTVG